MLEREILLGVV
uniref:Uncharacterized protein n=1 Tax=Arundo donax TaxID=35708 RepID=A0A0A8Y1E3_ARUDO